MRCKHEYRTLLEVNPLECDGSLALGSDIAGHPHCQRPLDDNKPQLRTETNIFYANCIHVLPLRSVLQQYLLKFGN